MIGGRRLRRRAAVRRDHARLPRRAQGRRDGPRLRVLVLRRAGLRPRRASCSARSACPGAVNFCLRRRRTQPPADHHRHGGLGRRTRPRKEPDRHDLAVHPPASSTTPASTPCSTPPSSTRCDNGHRVVIAVVERVRRARRAAAHARRAGRQLARRRRQGAHRGDLRPPEPRARGAGQRRAPRRARAPRRPGADRRDPAEGRRRGRRRDRHQRRDPRRGRGGLDRRRRRASSRRPTVPALSVRRTRGAPPRPSPSRVRPARRRARVRRRRRGRRSRSASGAPTTPRWPASASPPTRRAPRRSTAARARTSRTRRPAAAPRRCTSRAPCRSRAASRSSATATSIGAVGVSGASSADEDQELAILGSVGALPRRNGSSNGACVLRRLQPCQAQFATGGLLLDAGAYKLDAGRRERTRRGRVPRPHGRRHAHRRRHRDDPHRRRDGRRAQHGGWRAAGRLGHRGPRPRTVTGRCAGGSRRCAAPVHPGCRTRSCTSW